MNAMLSIDWYSIGNKIWDRLTSRAALLIYAGLVLALIIAIVVRVIVAEFNRVAMLKNALEGEEKSERQQILETARKTIEEELEPIKDLACQTVVAPNASAKTVIASNGAMSEEESEEEGSRFYMLTEIDKYYERYTPPEYDGEMSLKEICEEFRNYSAGALKLYYDIEDIRRFIGGLSVTKLIILQGMSGTGKTSLAYAFGEFLDNKTVVVPIQPMWKERTDLVGYYNEFTRKFNETTLLYKMYEADYNEDIYITVVDEMNIARVEYYFEEFLSLL